MDQMGDEASLTEKCLLLIVAHRRFENFDRRKNPQMAMLALIYLSIASFP
jgi:hypothetical protein